METGNLSHRQMEALRERSRQASRERYLEESRKRFDRIMTKKMRTTFIGAIAQFEEQFGVLWGHGKDKDTLTEQELEFRELWEVTRTNILNNSNAQLRALKSELQNQVVEWQRYHMDLPVKPLPEKKNETGQVYG